MGARELWKTLEHAIKEHTGLSPAIFFTFLSVAAAFFYAVSAYFKPAPVPRKREAVMEPLEPLPPPAQLGEITDADLSAFDGSDPKKPLLMAIKGQIYDVTQSRMFYGPGGPYALFAGKDASRALAKMSFEQKDLTGDISGLGSFELDALQDWEYKFMSKYVKVGAIKKTVPVTDNSSNDNPITEATEIAESKNFNPVSHDAVTVHPDVDTEKISELKLAEPKEEDVGQAEDKKE